MRSSQPLSCAADPTSRTAAVEPIGRFTIAFSAWLKLPRSVYEGTSSAAASKCVGSGAFGTSFMVPPIEPAP